MQSGRTLAWVTHVHPSNSIISLLFSPRASLVCTSEALQVVLQSSQCLGFRIQIAFQSNTSITVMSYTESF